MQAYIAQYNELSKVEVPEKNLDVLYFAGCDFNCQYCNVQHFLNFKEEFLVDIRVIKEKIRSKGQNIEGVLFTGGEPCLQRQAVLEIARFSKKIGLKTYLHTNGSKPDCLHSLFKESLIDTLIFDIKTPFEPEIFEKTTKSKTFFKTPETILSDIDASLRLIREYKQNVEFRTVIIPSILFKKEDMLAIADKIHTFSSLWNIVKFNPEKCISKKLEALNPPSDSFLQSIKEVVNQKYPQFIVETN